ncbi:hypothetical protein KNT87_gp158 [Erwinia phage Cronus]|uniref:Uncharacterized protein n=1 Tax=Erwinia phage Cronus TaxID=2163633 RepID=A0A2S1GLZ3_9CAUD|nr:hypothetical protein KNT87_gp158 [Erwinia phage Cronus]AWD90411.1 hypothetical protein [Erwinia phage Cronus]
MKIADITEEYNRLLNEVEDSPNDYFAWKTLIHDRKFTHVIIDNELFEISKWGPSNKIGTIEKVD